jgi:MtrB/PioB family decaheme-associated outer membrane protein
MQKVFITALLVSAVVAATVAVRPAHADTEGHATFGSQWWTQNQNEAKWEEFREVPLGGFLESFSIRNVEDRRSLVVFGVQALQRDQSTGVTWRDGARLRLDLGYVQTPHVFGRAARSPFTSVRPGRLALPDSLQRLNQDNPAAFVATMSDLLSNASRVEDEFRTDISKVRLRGRADRHWSLELRGQRRSRSGTKPFGAAFGFNSAIEVPMPITQRIVDADALLEYKRNRLTVQGGFGVSDFHNDVDRLIVDNPKRITDRTSPTAYTGGDGSTLGQWDLAPDNRSLRGTLSAAVQLPRNSAFSASLALAQSKQNDTWLPHTVNTAIADSLVRLPGTSTDAEALVLSQDYRVNTRQWSRVSGAVRVHHDKYDNKTPEHRFNGAVRMDQTFENVILTSHPFSNSQVTAGVDVDVDVLDPLTVGALYEFRRREHELREVEQDDENVVGGRLRLRPVSQLSMRAEFRHGKREGDGFVSNDYRSGGVLIEQPGLRRYDVADREQDRLTSSMDWAVAPNVSLGAGYRWTHNDYGKGTTNRATVDTLGFLGLRDEERHSVSAGATVTWKERVAWMVGGGFERVTTLQKSRESGATVVLADTTSWTADLKDDNVYVYASTEWWAKPDKLSLGLSYTFSHALGAFTLGNFIGTARDLSDTEYDFQDLQIEARWRLRANMDLAGRYGFERFDVSDFASDNVPLLNVATGTANAIFLGDSLLDYRAHRVAIVATQRF